MERSDILKQLNEIFIDVMDLDPEFKLSEDMTADDIDEWDSLSHIQLMVAIEKSWGIKFTAKEILNWEDIHDCIDSISAKLM
jgi:acyl carrier protein